jgi:hypothetical protein
LSCKHVYTGQTGKSFRNRFKEHITHIICNQSESKQGDHEYETIDNTMGIIKIAQIGGHLDALERFYIYKASKCKLILKKQYATGTNVLFGLITN